MKLVIESVLRNIAHKEVDRLPQKTAVCDMLLECLTCAQARIGEELSQDDGLRCVLSLESTPIKIRPGVHFRGVSAHALHIHLYDDHDVFAWFPTGYGKSLCFQLLTETDKL